MFRLILTLCISSDSNLVCVNTFSLVRSFLSIIYFFAWRVSVFGVILVRIFPHSDWIRSDISWYVYEMYMRYEVSLRIQPKCRKMPTRITPNTDTFRQCLLWILDTLSSTFLCTYILLKFNGFSSAFIVDFQQEFVHKRVYYFWQLNLF